MRAVPPACLPSSEGRLGSPGDQIGCTGNGTPSGTRARRPSTRLPPIPARLQDLTAIWLPRAVLLACGAVVPVIT